MSIEALMEMYDMTREEVEEVLFSQSSDYRKKNKKSFEKDLTNSTQSAIL